MTHTPACPHCGRTSETAVYAAAHARACLHDPAIRARTLAAMADDAHPGHAVQVRAYSVRRVTCGAPSIARLSTQYGSWADICATLGLLPAVANAQCPHCGAVFARRSSMSAHAAACPHSPAIRALVLAALCSAAAPGMAVTFWEYDERAAPNAPSSATLRGRYGSWADVCAAFGLGVPAMKMQPSKAHLEAREAAVTAEIAADLAAALVRHGVELVSTGGTAKALREAGVIRAEVALLDRSAARRCGGRGDAQ